MRVLAQEYLTSKKKKKVKPTKQNSHLGGRAEKKMAQASRPSLGGPGSLRCKLAEVFLLTENTCSSPINSGYIGSGVTVVVQM